ncbi:GNAT family N-acetyltransferase [Bacillus sp. FJAT-22090]|uniref:GNAT family N-acetyltransferase n=1 Tax=Bacillus sp. FJAT-22090 TaxID=1581038 RepID=UPI0011A50C31|nr:GNAT family N-acetyltransferase [Bacillus sp. FJAT-22090]
MDISIMTVSLPLDADTRKEIEELLAKDQVDYTSLLSIEELTDSSLKGFCVLAYDDDADKLVGVLSAIDRLATGDYEWSVFVSPSVRRHGLGTGLIQELDRNLTLRGAVYDLALVPEESQAGHEMLEKIGYVHDFSERTMVANAELNLPPSELEILPYSFEQTELIEVLVSAFGDTIDEIINFIAFNTQTPNRRLMIAKLENKLVGTVTIVDESDKLWITGLGVHEHARGKGIAAAILKWAKNEAYTLGKANIYLDVETENETALSVYNKAGFKTTQLTHFYRKG